MAPTSEAGLPRVLLKTLFGQIILELYPDRAPESVAYFLDCLDRGRLANSSIFRIVTPENESGDQTVPIDVVQGGCMPMAPEEMDRIKHETTEETGLSHQRGTVSLARFEPGQVYGSFFLCLRDEPALDFGGRRHADGLGFAAFGRLVEGFAVLEQLRDCAEADCFMKNPVPVTVRRNVL